MSPPVWPLMLPLHLVPGENRALLEASAQAPKLGQELQTQNESENENETLGGFEEVQIPEQGSSSGMMTPSSSRQQVQLLCF